MTFWLAMYQIIELISLIIKDGQEGGLRINGNTIATTWSRVGGVASSWVSVGSNSNRFTHTSNVDFAAMVYGASDRESYGFALGADMTDSGVSPHN